MKESQNDEELMKKPSSKKENAKEFDIISFDEDEDTKSVFSLFGFELIAPKGMKNPLLIYSLFIIVNIILFFVFRSFLK